MRTLGQRLRRIGRRDDGNSLIEVAVIAPVMVLLVCYAIDFGYYFLVAMNMTAAARSAAEYSVQGFASPGATSLPAAGSLTTATSVAALAVGDMGNLAKTSTLASVQVCSASANTSGTNTVACKSYGASSASFTPDTDPAPALFQLNRVDVTYTIQPPIALSFFHVTWTPPATFHRYVEMRAMN
jgi:Flp pilus assembly protein TadG